MQGCSPCYPQVACLGSPSGGPSALAWTPPRQWPSPLSSSLQQGLWFAWARALSAPVPCAPAALLAGVVWASATAASSMSFCLGPGRPCQGEDSQTSSPFTGSAARGGCWVLGPPHICSPVDRGAWQAVVPRAAESQERPKRLSTHMHALSLLRGLQDPEESRFLRWGFWPFLPGPTCTERCRFSPLGVHFSLLQSTLSHSPSAISSLSLRSLVSKCSVGPPPLSVACATAESFPFLTGM